MNSTPSLSSHNHFDVLYVENTNDIETEKQDIDNADSFLRGAVY